MPTDGVKVTTRAAARADSENVSEVSEAPTLRSLDCKLDSILHILDKNSTDIVDIKKEQKDLGISIELCHSSISDIKLMLDEQGKQIDTCNEEVKAMKEENMALNRKVNSLKFEINVLEQYSHRNNLLVYGIPEDKNENICSVMRRLANALQFQDWSDSLIDIVHRFGQPTTKNPRPIIIKFISRLNRNEFLNRKKVRRNLRASDLGYSSENLIYVNESLTLANRELLKLTREAARLKNYSQVWTANCSIYVRKERGKMPVIKINSVRDVNNL